MREARGEEKVERRVVRRGEVFLFEMTIQGGRLEKNRPVLVVQNDAGNAAGAETIVAAIRSARHRPLPILVPVSRGTGGLDRDSFVDAGQLMTVPIHALGRRLGTVPSSVMDVVDRALEVSLGLEP